MMLAGGSLASKLFHLSSPDPSVFFGINIGRSLQVKAQVKATP